ncbi:MAG TPA: HAD family hydrolase [Candidatus Bathyarchaeia archaeon]|nr:HAD family hydrolase [Candidatus Bathyarchaeia archaeon]
MSYRAVFFDLFDTLVLFHRERLPEVSVNGRVMRSTAGHLHAAFRPYAPGVELPVFVDALFWSWKEAERIRSESHREVAAPERFGMLFHRLGLERVPDDARELLLATHMRELSRVVECPSHHAPLLAELGRRYRLAVVSNFDYAPTCRAILEREGIAGLFDTVVISDEVGWRKPKPVIFETALDRLGLRPAEALFVGDRADIDVLGARGVGMPTVWINREASGLPEDIPAPDFEIRDLDELRGILRIP